MSRITVAVLFGGVSPEHEVSKMSAFNVIQALNPEKYNIVPIYITKDGRWLLYDGAIESVGHANLEKLDTQAFISPDTGLGPVIRLVSDRAKNIPVDIVFPVLHGKYGEDGCVQGLLELARIPYVGCGVLASGICMDKALTKSIAAALGIAQVKHIIFSKKDAENMNKICASIKRRLGFPCFIKPANSGSSIGISRATDNESLKAAITKSFEYDNKIIAEKAVNGRELECSVLGNLEPAASQIGEIIAPAGFYSYDAKYVDDGSKTITNPELPDGIADEIKKQSLKIFRAVGGLGMARADFFLEAETNRIIFNEINTIPGFTAISMYSMLWQASGMTFGDLCGRLIELGMERYEL